MPWRKVSVVGQRLELVELMRARGGPGVAELARRFGVSRKTAYKWLARYRAGDRELADRSRRPESSPGRCRREVEERVVALRREHPAWGPRKLRQYLLDQEGRTDVPAASTLGQVLRRRGLIAGDAWERHTAYRRFEYPGPNDLWQMDFKGPFPTLREGACNPLCVVDDHSRYALGVRACADQEMATVREQLTRLFRTYGLPAGMLADNGPAWSRRSGLCVWLMRLGVRVLHGRPAHPQTQGKLERFNRTAEGRGDRVPELCGPGGVPGTVRRLAGGVQPPAAARGVGDEDAGQPVPAERPELPARRCRRSSTGRGTGGVVVHRRTGELSYAGRRVAVGTAYCGLPVGVRATLVDGVRAAYFCHQKVAEIDLRQR